MDILIPKFIKYQLYLLQLENYELGRYFKLLWAKGFWPKKNQEQRKELVWTKKAMALMLMAVALHLFIILLSGFVALNSSKTLDSFFTALILSAIIVLPFYFILFSVALLILKPLDSLVKKQIAAKAKSKIHDLESKIKIIGIAGSYGKTTMKEVLAEVLGARFKVQATPESVNTPVGIARWILSKVNDSTEVIIVEMGEHYKNDIKEICEIVKPDIAVVTGINESHLERMKDMDTVTSTVFEIVSNSKQKAMVVLNADDKRVMENYKKFVWPDHGVQEFRISNFEFRMFDVEKLVWKVKGDDIGGSEVNLLGEYALGDVDAAVKIGKSLGMSNEEIKKGIANIKPVEHRLQPIKSGSNVLVIDDSYNGNPEGVKEAIKVLSHFTNRRKIIITPGLVEMGKSSAEVHRTIGKELIGVADIVILIKNSVTGFIAEGLSTTPSRQGGTPLLSQEGNPAAPQGTQDNRGASPPNIGGVPSKAGGGSIPKIIWFNSALEAHAELKNILKPGDVVLFQNDWGDQYI